MTQGRRRPRLDLRGLYLYVPPYSNSLLLYDRQTSCWTVRLVDMGLFNRCAFGSYVGSLRRYFRFNSRGAIREIECPEAHLGITSS